MRSWPVALAALAIATPAEAQLLSPGKLAKAHAHLEGLSNCGKCHPAGGKLSETLCLDCHDELAPSIAKGRGLHGRIPAAERACERCHSDHQGLEHSLVDFGPRGQKGFDHRRVGWPLLGAHAKEKCEACHDARRIDDPKVKQLLARTAGKRTWLGVPRACVACHFDEHRGQLGDDCAKCHDTKAFQPAPGFDHRKTAYPLTGAHRKVACAKCHPSSPDPDPPSDPARPPKHASFAVYAPVRHGQCSSCHEDPHDGRFGARCSECHQTSSWGQVKAAKVKARGFHDQTRYPLEGAHEAVSCPACHGPSKVQKRAVFRGLPFDRCDRCHHDAHFAQVSTECERCHDVVRFRAPRFGPAEHAGLPFPLDGAHRVAPCRSCHAKRPGLLERFPAAIARRLELSKRPRLVSLRELTPKVPPDACERCHRDPHGGQFSELGGRVHESAAPTEGRVARACAACHQADDFRRVRFDHQKDSRFPLDGAHTKTACRGCHVPEGPAPIIRYVGTPMRCAGCHVDAHRGQLSAAEGCERCHTTQAFAPATVDHAAAYPLEGRHAEVACDRCHPREPRSGVVRYRPVPTRCADCHYDVHEGQMATYVGVTAPRAPTPCEGCHDPAGFLPARFDHDRTRFPLVEAHQKVACAGCHEPGDTLRGPDAPAPPPTACGGCHRDVHGARFGARCESCHTPTRFDDAVDPGAHRTTGFPLIGGHAGLPCAECHTDRASRRFARAALDCARCHGADVARTRGTAIDHEVLGFGPRCAECHGPVRFTDARFPAHELCFAIGRGPHRGIGCRDCHTSVQAPATGGGCATSTARCTLCHEHTCDRSDRRHREVLGYQCKDRKCYECHRFAEP